MKSLILLSTLSLIFHSSPVFSQSLNDSTIKNQSLINESILSTNDRTYFSLFQGLGWQRYNGSEHKLSPLLFEGQIAPSFFLRLNKHFNIAISPKVIIRMFNEYSLPVRTPSYMPNLIIYHKVKWDKVESFLGYNNGLVFFTYKYSHHSNGQDGPFYIPGTKDINFKDGNFSSDYAEIAFNITNLDTARTVINNNGRLAFEYQFEFDRESALHDIYYYYKITASNAFVYGNKRWRNTYQVSYMFGKDGFTPRWSADVWLSRRFYTGSDFSIFTRMYLGPDYYNLRYDRTIYVFSFGLLADPLNIPIFK